MVISYFWWLYHYSKMWNIEIIKNNFVFKCLTGTQCIKTTKRVKINLNIKINWMKLHKPHVFTMLNTYLILVKQLISMTDQVLRLRHRGASLWNSTLKQDVWAGRRTTAAMVTEQAQWKHEECSGGLTLLFSSLSGHSLFRILVQDTPTLRAKKVLQLQPSEEEMGSN